MRILIAGGTGLLGKELVQRLLAKNHAVWVLTRHPETPSGLSGVQFIGWDGKTIQGGGERVGAFDAVINLAGENIGASRWTAERKAQIRTSRIEAGQAIVAAIRSSAQKPAVLIQASGVGAYGPSGDQVVDETSPYGSDYLARVSVDWENSTQAVEAWGVRRVVIRTGLVMTRSGGWMAPLLLPFRLFVGGPLGNGKQWWPWIHIEDYVQSVIQLIERSDSTGVYNIVGPNPCRMEEFGTVLASVIKRPYWFPTPGFGLKLLLGEMSTLVLDGQRAMPKKLLEGGYVYAYPELRPALIDLFG
jgi:uncharacterized protein (TIGR01777 family)